MKPLVLCLGNEVLSDDGFGPAVGARLRGDPAFLARCDLAVASLAGFALLDLLQGRDRVLIVDAVDPAAMGAWSGPARGPGVLHFLPGCKLVPSHNLVGSHQLSLPVALELGRRFGYAMPRTLDILACEAQDLRTMAERLTPPVQQAVDRAVALAGRWRPGRWR